MDETDETDETAETAEMATEYAVPRRFLDRCTADHADSSADPPRKAYQ